MVRLAATNLDVYVDGDRVGWVMDCGDCWRVGLYGRLRKRGMSLPDYDSKAEAVKGVVAAAAK